MRLHRPLIATLSACALALSAQAPASAAPPTGGIDQVLVFSFEYTPVAVFDQPKGCNILPAGAHVLINQTQRTVTIYGDPACLFPIFPFQKVAPGNGTHVSPIGSFSIDNQ
ncbi:hypothetical protein [Actinokineospora enzanensis]|uniref:hypothetical protein n=1 Tax=Actinokineospora enzanensis TaxID=155975 RepID=UPI00035E7679|nr:hypothetical protein [Actinokineospora enzanensis]